MSKVPEMKVLVFLAFFLTFSQSRPLINPGPQILKSFEINNTQSLQKGCTYTVDIITSCSSPRYTRDNIGISFGDAYNNQVYVPRLNDPYSLAFERCSQDTYDIWGPCLRQVCYLYVRRSGNDGWKLETITVSGYTIKTITFPYKSYVPADIWYGFNFCEGVSTSST